MFVFKFITFNCYFNKFTGKDMSFSIVQKLDGTRFVQFVEHGKTYGSDERRGKHGFVLSRYQWSTLIKEVGDIMK